MRIPSLNTNPIQLVKPVWKNFSTTDTRKVFENFSVKKRDLGNLSVGISDCRDGFGRWIIEIKNNLGRVLGKEVISINKQNSSLNFKNCADEFFFCKQKQTYINYCTYQDDRYNFNDPRVGIA